MATLSKKQTNAVEATVEFDPVKYHRKYRELKRRVTQIENDNDKLLVKLSRTRKNVQRLRLERRLLLERLERLPPSQQALDVIMAASQPDPTSPLDLSDVDVDETEVEPTASAAQIKAMKQRYATDPQAPKRPPNAFFMFCQENRAQLMETHPDQHVSELTRLLGVRWKQMTAQQKKRYYEVYEAAVARYEKELIQYNSTQPPAPPPAAVAATTSATKMEVDA